MSVFTADEMRAHLRAQKIPEGAIERAIRRAINLGEIGNPLLDEMSWAPTVDEDDERLEKEIVAHADKQLRALGFVVVNYSQPRATKQTPGVQDHEYFHPGRRIFLKWEAKTARGEQSPAQRHYQELCEACGVPYVLGTDQDLFAWLVAQRIAVRDASGNLVTPQYEQQRSI